MADPMDAALARAAERTGELAGGIDRAQLALLEPSTWGQISEWLALTYVVPVTSWTDPQLDVSGFEVTSGYVERYWLPILGPTGLCALRALQFGPEVVDVPLGPLAGSLGVGGSAGRQSVVVRTLTRLTTFQLARVRAGRLEVRDRVPRLTGRQQQRLPAHLQTAHARHWQRGSS